MRQKRKPAIVMRFVAPLLGASLLLVSAGSVAAAEPGIYSFDVFNCALYNEAGDLVDPAVVPGGSEIVLWEGWFTKTRGQLQSFMNNATWVLTVNDEPVDVTPTFSGLLNFGSTWADLFFYSAGTLESGGSFRIHYDNVLKSASYDGFAHYAKGSVYNGGVDCTVTAT